MYHVELRQFPHNLCHFNLDERELGAIVEAWTTDPWVEIEGRKWNPDKAKLKILEGPEIPLDQLTMGRGWRTAEREGTDVTERVLAAAKAAAPASQSPPRRPPRRGPAAQRSRTLRSWPTRWASSCCRCSPTDPRRYLRVAAGRRALPRALARRMPRCSPNAQSDRCCRHA